MYTSNNKHMYKELNFDIKTREDRVPQDNVWYAVLLVALLWLSVIVYL